MKKLKKASAVARLQEVLERGYLVTNEDGDLGLCIHVADGTGEGIETIAEQDAPFLTKGERDEVNGNGRIGVVRGRGAIAKTLDWLVAGQPAPAAPSVPPSEDAP